MNLENSVSLTYLTKKEILNLEKRKLIATKNLIDFTLKNNNLFFSWFKRNLIILEIEEIFLGRL